MVGFLDVENNKLAGDAWFCFRWVVRKRTRTRSPATGLLAGSSYGFYFFSIFSEELGSLAAISVLAIYLTLFLTIAHSAKKLHSNFARFLSYGISPDHN
jgi:hypothetical protein